MADTLVGLAIWGALFIGFYAAEVPESGPAPATAELKAAGLGIVPALPWFASATYGVVMVRRCSRLKESRRRP